MRRMIGAYVSGLLMSKKCSECCEQLKKANLCDLARSVDWNVISKGKRPAERVR